MYNVFIYDPGWIDIDGLVRMRGRVRYVVCTEEDGIYYQNDGRYVFASDDLRDLAFYTREDSARRAARHEYGTSSVCPDVVRRDEKRNAE